jgi:hypothetical protein
VRPGFDDGPPGLSEIETRNFLGYLTVADDCVFAIGGHLRTLDDHFSPSWAELVLLRVGFESAAGAWWLRIDSSEAVGRALIDEICRLQRVVNDCTERLVTATSDDAALAAEMDSASRMRSSLLATRKDLGLQHIDRPGETKLAMTYFGAVYPSAAHPLESLGIDGQLYLSGLMSFILAHRTAHLLREYPGAKQRFPSWTDGFAP